jgi:hypothetical protein
MRLKAETLSVLIQVFMDIYVCMYMYMCMYTFMYIKVCGVYICINIYIYKCGARASGGETYLGGYLSSLCTCQKG